jgi:hypothetical protein
LSVHGAIVPAACTRRRLSGAALART